MQYSIYTYHKREHLLFSFVPILQSANQAHSSKSTYSLSIRYICVLVLIIENVFNKEFWFVHMLKL